ncbi:hypothetical protein LCGC14_1371610 [marine sediment metagenome]|uniref:Transmembrane protein n=1 Tax=marine sediment metagenome TaxID=412755 RepID=A0A0F9K5E3_9ZZZZ
MDKDFEDCNFYYFVGGFLVAVAILLGLLTFVPLSVRVDAEPEVAWCEEWEFFNCEPEVCNEGSVSDSQSFVSLKFLILEDINGWSDATVESVNCECFSKKRVWRRC